MGLFDAIVPRPTATKADDAVEALFNAGPLDACHVMLATMAYNPPEPAMAYSRLAVCRDLAEHGIKHTIHETTGDSLVTRGRHEVMTDFLSTPASHLLWWDADIEATQHDVVRTMLATGHDVIGGACPYRNDSGRVVMNLRDEDRKSGRIETDDHGCVKVAEVGTGFLLISRAAIVKLCGKHPELFYRSDIPDNVTGKPSGRPMWALFDTALLGQRLMSEDYMFCRRWRDAGGDVYVHAAAEFRHWGKKAYEGSFLRTLNARAT